MILLSSFSPFSLSDACASSAVPLNSSSQQQISSEFFFCLLLSSAFLMGQKPTIWLSAGTVYYTVLPFLSPHDTQSSSKRHTACHQQHSRKSDILRNQLKTTFMTLLSRGGRGKEENAHGIPPQLCRCGSTQLMYFAGFRLP